MWQGEVMFLGKLHGEAESSTGSEALHRTPAMGLKVK